MDEPKRDDNELPKPKKVRTRPRPKGLAEEISSKIAAFLAWCERQELCAIVSVHGFDRLNREQLDDFGIAGENDPCLKGMAAEIEELTTAELDKR